MELTTAAMGGKLYENGLYGEPERGAMERVLSSTNEGPARVLDLGELHAGPCSDFATWM